ncbi:helix-turn-helix domain-containing protein [Massilia pinisoli]|uniref:Helix-turn-helix domain-containing protein n=1 Tax=Massilia pinisoli TaxID=1772194 RepID=A0ABT1ZQG1_9BURK|nr:helix-turn-helix domain-containing protein [Massilia pinisoli]MCS0582156.1 helix-turn-helix domain-containing protein [Massilia pinisoli]
MSKRKPLDKAEARERRNRMLETAAAARLSLTDGVREMRAIAGMTQEEFARHRGVSARVIKAIELDQANPTVATMNRIGQFFGLQVGFVPIERASQGDGLAQPAIANVGHGDVTFSDAIRAVAQLQQDLLARMRELDEMAANLGATKGRAVEPPPTTPHSGTDSSPAKAEARRRTQKDTATNKIDTAKKRASRST